jgi:hypothetical protein
MKLLVSTLFRHAAGASKPLMGKSLGDIALISTGVAMAASSAIFASYMLMQRDHAPEVNGMQYLAIFAKPHGSSHPMIIDAPAPASVRAPAPAPAPAAPPPLVAIANPATAPKVAGDGLDMAPTGSIARGAATSVAPEAFRILAIEPGVAWLTNGSEIRAVKPGDTAPGLGRIASIQKLDGRWTLIDDSGSPLLTSEAPDSKDGSSPFARRLIFGSDH